MWPRGIAATKVPYGILGFYPTTTDYCYNVSLVTGNVFEYRILIHAVLINRSLGNFGGCAYKQMCFPIVVH